jgi:hypothetical protein
MGGIPSRDEEILPRRPRQFRRKATWVISARMLNVVPIIAACTH